MSARCGNAIAKDRCDIDGFAEVAIDVFAKAFHSGDH